MSAAIVAGRDVAPLHEFGEEVLDLVALAIESLVVSLGEFAAAARRDAGFDAPGFEVFAEPGAVIAAIGNQA